MKSNKIIISLIAALSTITGSSYSAAPPEPLPSARGKIVKKSTLPQQPQDQKKLAATQKERESYQKMSTELEQLLNQKEASERIFNQRIAENIKFIEQYNTQKQSLKRSKNAQNAAAKDREIKALDRAKYDNIAATNLLLITKLQSAEKYYLAYIATLKSQLANTQSQFRKCDEKLHALLTEQMYPDADPVRKPANTVFTPSANQPVTTQSAAAK